MKTGEYTSWQLRLVSWATFGLTWLVLLCYIGLLIWNGQTRPLDLTNPQGLVASFFRLIALPGLPASPPADGLLFVLVCGIFVLALRTSPALLRPKPVTSAPISITSPAEATNPALPAPAPPEPTTLRRIFISHSSGDNEFGVALTDRLRAAGFDVWYDSHGGPGADGSWEGGIPPATYWQDDIMRELTSRPIFLVILTPQSAASRWVHDEIGLAWSQKNSANVTDGKIIVPVLRQPCAVPPLVTLVQYVDYRPEVSDRAAFEKLLSALRHGATIPAPPVEVGPPFDIAVLPGVARFIGREDDAQAVIRLLTGTGGDGGAIAGIASTNGLAGIGKTALATDVIRRLMAANAFPDGIAVVVARDAYDPVLLLKQVLARFSDGRRPPDDNDLATLGDRARQMLGGKRALVVLDNVEPGAHVDEVAQALRSAGAALLLTSRAELPAVPREARVKLDVLPLPEALDLFAAYYGRGAALDLTAAELRDVTTIVTLLGRHTLAVKLQAANAASLERPLDRLAAELEANPDKALVLEDGTEAVRYVLDSSYAALEPAAQRLFVALGAFATSDVGREAALFMGRVAAPNATDEGEMSDDEAETQAMAERSLKALITLRLADPGLDETMPEESDRERVRLHPLVYTYAHTRFDCLRPPEKEAIARAVTQWYADYSNEVVDDALETDERNILGALAWALAASDDTLLIRLCLGNANYWNTHSRTAAREEYLPAAVAAAERQVAAERSDETVRRMAILHGHYASLLRQLGKMREFREMATASLEEYQAAHDQRGEGVALSLLGDLAMREGDIVTAKTHFTGCLKIMQMIHDQQGEGIAFGKLANIAMQEGDLTTAKIYYRHSLEIMQAVHDLREEGIALSGMGRLANQEGDLATAKAHYTRYLAIMQAVHDQREEGVAWFNLAAVQEAEGDLDQAEQGYRQSLTIGLRLQLPPQIAPPLEGLGTFLLAHKRDRDEGCQLLAQAADLYTQIGQDDDAMRVRQRAAALGCNLPATGE